MSSFVSAQDIVYDDPWHFHVTIKSPDESQTLFTYDPFGPIDARPFLLNRIQVREPTIASPGAFEFGIKTSPRYPFALRNIPSGAVVEVKAGQTEDTYEKLIDGVIDVRAFNVRRQFYAMDILYQGLGIGHVDSHTLVSMRKQPVVTDLINNVLNNPEFKIPNLLYEALTSTTILPLSNELSVAERAGYDLSEVLTSPVAEFLGGIDFTGTMAGLINIFTQASGSGYIVDGNRKVKLRYPNSVHSGHIIKPYPGPALARLDSADYVSFYMPPLSWYDTIAYDAGVVQGVKLNYSNQNLAISGPEEINKDYYELAQQDLVWKFLPTNTLLQDLAFVLSKLGTGHSDIEDALGLDGLLGYIITDKVNNPSKKIVAQFKVPYDSIPETPSVVTDVQMTWLVGNLNLDNPHWIYLAHSGLDSDNTVRIHTDGDSDTLSTDDNPRRVGFKTPPTPKQDLIGNKFYENFSYTNQGPVPLYKFLANQLESLFIENSIASRKWTPFRPREIQINAPFIKDADTGYQYAQAYLNFASKKKVVFNDIEITMPRKWIHPLEVVDIAIPEYDYPITSPLRAEASSTMVEATWFDPRKPFGFDTMKLSLLGYVSAGDDVGPSTLAEGVCLDC